MDDFCALAVASGVETGLECPDNGVAGCARSSMAVTGALEIGSSSDSLASGKSAGQFRRERKKCAVSKSDALHARLLIAEQLLSGVSLRCDSSEGRLDDMQQFFDCNFRMLVQEEVRLCLNLPCNSVAGAPPGLRRPELHEKFDIFSEPDLAENKFSSLSPLSDALDAQVAHIDSLISTLKTPPLVVHQYNEGINSPSQIVQNSSAAEALLFAPVANSLAVCDFVDAHALEIEPQFVSQLVVHCYRDPDVCNPQIPQSATVDTVIVAVNVENTVYCTHEHVSLHIEPQVLTNQTVVEAQVCGHLDSVFKTLLFEYREFSERLLGHVASCASYHELQEQCCDVYTTVSRCDSVVQSLCESDESPLSVKLEIVQEQFNVVSDAADTFKAAFDEQGRLGFDSGYSSSDSESGASSDSET